jgi:hypothetical protein
LVELKSGDLNITMVQNEAVERALGGVGSTQEEAEVLKMEEAFRAEGATSHMCSHGILHRYMLVLKICFNF